MRWGTKAKAGRQGKNPKFILSGAAYVSAFLASGGGGRQQGPAAMTNKKLGKLGNFDQIGAEIGVRLSNGKKFKKIFRLFSWRRSIWKI
jgi:hypothetical protein